MTEYRWIRYRTRHAWGNSEWSYKEVPFDPDEASVPNQLINAGIDPDSEYCWSDKYRGFDAEFIDVPPDDFVVRERQAATRAILESQKYLERLFEIVTEQDKNP